jgi:hypothetical protein
MSYFYRVHGLNIASDFELPELAQRVHLGDQPDVWFRLLALPQFSDAKPTSLPYLWTVGADALFIIESVARENVARENVARENVAREIVAREIVARYLVRGGREILFDPAPGADVALARAFLFGTVMAMVCLQRGLLALHASAVAFEDRVVAFTGIQGAGKSTLAAHCVAAGGALMSDDLLVVSLDNSGQAVAQPGMPKVKLWRDALTNLGRSSEGLQPDWVRAEKFHVPVKHASMPLPLSQLYIVGENESMPPGSFRRLTGASAIHAIVANTYRLDYMEWAGHRATHFRQCAALAKAIEVIDFRPERIAENLPFVVSQVVASVNAVT